ncbi:MAG: hypothetical protein B6D58_01635 [candidate division Zixibacteria bacterium 4484_95]|nr:MAG: hypothetical protein B6D58_01635 [candidate division Zixibacteria bacterium 4484_95]RKX20069.1 MAG: hypothetical protein DRP26_02335 [candidate division Zixibacteria bacterium]
MRRVILFVILLTVSAWADQIDDLIDDGRFHEAYNRLLSAYEKSPDKIEYLFLMGRSALSGESSAAFFKDYINKASNNSHLVNWARLYLGKYYLAQNLYVAARKHLEDIDDNSPFGMEASYLAARCYMLSTEYDRAARAFKDIINRYENNDSNGYENNQSNYYYWAVLNLADTKYASGDFEQAIRFYKQLLQPSLEKDVFALALLGLSETSRKMNRRDDANRYYHLYKERYDSGINPIALETEMTDSGQPSKIADTKYYIQVGVFSDKARAEKMSTLYKKNGYYALIENFAKEGQEFYRVLVGGYNSKQKAEFIKKRLEKAAGERYLILIR